VPRTLTSSGLRQRSRRSSQREAGRHIGSHGQRNGCRLRNAAAGPRHRDRVGAGRRVEATASVNEDVPDPVIDVGLKVAVTPVGRPLAVRATAELNPSTTVLVMVELPLLPCTTETDAGEADSVNVGLSKSAPVR